MAQNNASAPVVQVIDYPLTTHGRDLPTAGLPSPLPRLYGSRDRLYRLLQQPTMVDGALPLDPLTFSHNTCFRDAMLTILFALKPFMNFLDSVSPPPPPPHAAHQNASSASDMVKSLAKLGRAFWTPSGGEVYRPAILRAEINTFWAHWLNLGHQPRDHHGYLEIYDIQQFALFLLNELNDPTGVHLQQ